MNANNGENPNNFYKVGANMDQLIKAGMDKDYEWHGSTVVPNRVFTYFLNSEFDKADKLYRELKEKGMVASKNWLS